MVDLIRAEVAQVVEQQTEDPLPRQALVGVAQSAILCNSAKRASHILTKRCRSQAHTLLGTYN